MAGYSRQSTFSDGDSIGASLFNNEYDALATSFSNTTGHAHDGTANEGPVIGLIGDAGVVTPLNKVLIDTGNNNVGVWVDVSSVSTEQVIFTDGTIEPVTNDDIALGTVSKKYSNIYSNIYTSGDLTITDGVISDSSGLVDFGGDSLNNIGTVIANSLSASGVVAVTGTTTLNDTLNLRNSGDNTSVDMVVFADGNFSGGNAVFNLTVNTDDNSFSGTDAFKMIVADASGNGSLYDMEMHVNDIRAFQINSAGLVKLYEDFEVDGASRFDGDLDINASVDISGAVVIDADVDDGLTLTRAAGSNRILKYETAGVARWSLYTDGVAEGGSNVGSDFQIARYDDAGTYLGNALSITRSTGDFNFSNNIVVQRALQMDFGSGVRDAVQQAGADLYIDSFDGSTIFRQNGNITGLTLTSGNATFAGNIFLPSSGDIRSVSATDNISIGGGNATGVGSELYFYGQSHGSFASDYHFSTNNAIRYHYQNSASKHSFTGGIETSGDITLAGNIKWNGGGGSAGAMSANGDAAMHGNSAYGNFIWGQGTSYDVVLGSRGTNFAFGVVANTQRCQFAGDFFVGNSSPTGGTVGWSVRDNSGIGHYLTSGTSSTGAVNHVEFYNPNGNIGRITTSGSGTTFSTTSDPRVKSEFVAFDHSLAMQMVRDAVENKWAGIFTFKSDPNTPVAGYNAHAILDNQEGYGGVEGQGPRDAEIGSVVDGVEVRPAGIDQSKRVPLLEAALYGVMIKADEKDIEIQELKKRLEALEALIGN